MDVPAKTPPLAPLRARTWRQEAILRAVRASYRTRGLPPTFLEIVAATGITTTSVVSYNLRRLQEQGLIRIEDGVSRGIRLVRRPGEPCALCGHEPEGGDATITITHYGPGERATRCWRDVEDFCSRPPVVLVVTDHFTRHYCVRCFDQWKNRVRDMAASLGDGLGTRVLEDAGVSQDFEDRLRQRVGLELAAIMADEEKERTVNTKGQGI